MASNVSKALFAIVTITIITVSLINYSAIFDSRTSTEGSAGLVYHFIMYSIVAILSWIAFRKSRIRIILILGSSLLILGICLEFIQLYLPYRTFNPKDILANITGLAIGYCLVIMWQAISKNNRYSTQPKNL